MAGIIFPEDLPADRRQFVQNFYRVSDRPGSPEAHNEYASLFTNDAICIFSGAKYTNLVKMREGMWEKIAIRVHKPERVYKLNDDDLIVYGDADFTPKQGEAFQSTFFARMLFENDKLKFYEVAKRNA